MASTTISLVEEKVLLCPPWWILNKLMKATIGLTPGVHVDTLKQENRATMCLDLEVIDKSRAEALNRILVNRYPVGGVLVQVRVIYNGKPLPPDAKVLPPTELIETLKIALEGNPLFEKAILAHEPDRDRIEHVVAIFAPKVVQFWAELPQDYYGNKNLVAADAFTPQLVHCYPGGTALSFTTAKAPL